jgi:hypothetical protein
LFSLAQPGVDCELHKVSALRSKDRHQCGFFLLIEVTHSLIARRGHKPLDWIRFRKAVANRYVEHAAQEAQFVRHSLLSAIKRVFGDCLRSKTPVAQINELLLKVLAHNIRCLVHGIYELGIIPSFCAAAIPAQKLALL